MTGARARTALLALVLAAVALAGCSGGDATKAGGSGAPVTLRIGTNDTSGRPGADQIEEFARQVEELSGGRIRIEAVWEAAGKAADDWDQQVARLVVSRELDMGLIPARAWDTEGVTSLRALHAPFLVTSDELLDRIATGELADEMLDGLDKAGVVGLALLPEGLRHPFSFGDPLLSLDDYADTHIRTPRSDVAYAIFEALGATPDDLIGEEFSQAIADGSLTAADSAFALANSTLEGGTTVATGNVTFFPKANTLVVNADAFADLDEVQRGLLDEAAARTLQWAIEATPTDREAAETYCGQSSSIVLAGGADVAALEQAASPVYRELEKDPKTKDLIDRIRELKSEIGAPESGRVELCGSSAGGGAGATSGGDPSVLNGVWRVDLTYEEGVAAGLPKGVAAHEMGLQTIRMEDGQYEWRWRARDGEHDCPGTYEISGDVVRFADQPPGCSASWEATFALAGDEIRWSAAKSHYENDAVDQLIRELLHSKPWKKIADVESKEPAFPEGVYRVDLSEEFLLEWGLDPSLAYDWAGISTLTFEDGRWVHHQEHPESNEGGGDCSGPFSVDGGRISLVVGPDLEAIGCGSEGSLLFNARWTLDGDELRFSELQPAGFPWDAKPWKKIG
jgi:TRAP-type C4-dicarboxylate transport system substrate-binding protein